MGRVLNTDPEAPAAAKADILPVSTPTPEGQRELPQIFMGVAKLDGLLSSAGNAIKSFDGEREIGEALAMEGGRFTIIVARSEGPITFTVGGVDGHEKVAVWTMGDITKGLNLNAARR